MSIVDIIPWKSKKMRAVEKGFCQNLKFPFQRSWLTLPAVLGGTAYREPECAVADTPEEYVLTAKLPGVRLKDISLSYRQRTLTLRTETRGEAGDTPYFLGWENKARLYYRAFRLPSEIDPKASNLLFRHGVLKVKLPKADHPGDGAKPRKPAACG
jgi:HSP20 family protein